MVVFDHEKLHVYQGALEFNVLIAGMASDLQPAHRYVRDQLLRAALSIPLNIAEGNAKRPGPDRRRFLEIARGSAMECAAALDVLALTGGCAKTEHHSSKELLGRCVAMLTRMTNPQEHGVREDTLLYESPPTSSDSEPGQV